MPSLADIKAAAARTRGLINRTPVMASRTLNQKLGGSVFLKCEMFQRGGSFKFRGVTNTLLQISPEERQRGVITHSSGNHAQALALSAQLSGIHAVIVMPRNAPAVKVEATQNYGAEIVFCDNSVEARQETCASLVREHGYTLVHPYDDDRIIAGAGTAALELLEEVGTVDLITCPVGGGGLGSGTALAVKGKSKASRVVLVEPELANDAFRSFYERKLHPSTYPATIADGLRTSLSERTFGIICDNVDSIVTVSEQEILEAMRFLWERMKLVVEPSGAVGFAGLYSRKVPLDGKKAGVILSGGNVDTGPMFAQYQPPRP